MIVTFVLAIPKLDVRHALRSNETAMETVLREFEELGPSLERQRRAWQRFDEATARLDEALPSHAAGTQAAPVDAAAQLAECATLADALVRLSDSAAVKSALGERLAQLSARINTAKTATDEVKKRIFARQLSEKIFCVDGRSNTQSWQDRRIAAARKI